MTVVEANGKAEWDSSGILLSEVVRVRYHECVVDSWLGRGCVLEHHKVRALANEFIAFCGSNFEQEMPVYGVEPHKHLVFVLSRKCELVKKRIREAGHDALLLLALAQLHGTRLVSLLDLRVINKLVCRLVIRAHHHVVVAVEGLSVDRVHERRDFREDSASNSASFEGRRSGLFMLS